MAAFDIPPHPRRTARLALGVLSLIAMAGFAEGFLKQVAIDAPPPPPRASGQEPAIAVATPAPSLQVAEAPPKPHRPAASPDDATPELTLPDAATADAALAAADQAAAQPPPGADTSATAPASPPAEPEPASAPPPNQPNPLDPPTL